MCIGDTAGPAGRRNLFKQSLVVGTAKGYNVSLAQRDAKLNYVFLWYATCPAKDTEAHILSPEHKEMQKRHCHKFSVDIADSRECQW